MHKGQTVRFTLDNLGTFETLGRDVGGRRFAGPIVPAGTLGTYWKPDPAVSEPDWHLCLVVLDGTEYAVPVHRSMFEVVEDAANGR